MEERATGWSECPGGLAAGTGGCAARVFMTVPTHLAGTIEDSLRIEILTAGKRPSMDTAVGESGGRRSRGRFVEDRAFYVAGCGSAGGGSRRLFVNPPVGGGGFFAGE